MEDRDKEEELRDEIHDEKNNHCGRRPKEENTTSTHKDRPWENLRVATLIGKNTTRTEAPNQEGTLFQVNQVAKTRKDRTEDQYLRRNLRKYHLKRNRMTIENKSKQMRREI